MNFDETKINSKNVFNKLGKKRIILREMKQYKIPNALRFTIGDKEANEHFIKSIKEICK
jgi:histidinol-phosphate/aromatic aminotransferase/cobyric acid decarboxylase-like protein